jgi:methylated-DNA-[protein]-cysteine S-methyltransferase
VRLWRQASPFGDVTVVVSERGVREISLPGDDQPDAEAGAPDPRIERQLRDWFACKRHAFDVELDLDGVDGFRRTVLETLARDVGWGEIVTYGELAGMAGRPRAARAVGSAMRDNPLPFVIPCHRVVAAGGRIGGYGGGRNAVALKRKLLEREGVTGLRS